MSKRNRVIVDDHYAIDNDDLIGSPEDKSADLKKLSSVSAMFSQITVNAAMRQATSVFGQALANPNVNIRSVYKSILHNPISLISGMQFRMINGGIITGSLLAGQKVIGAETIASMNNVEKAGATALSSLFETIGGSFVEFASMKLIWTGIKIEDFLAKNNEALTKITDDNFWKIFNRIGNSDSEKTSVAKFYGENIKKFSSADIEAATKEINGSRELANEFTKWSKMKNIHFLDPTTHRILGECFGNSAKLTASDFIKISSATYFPWWTRNFATFAPLYFGINADGKTNTPRLVTSAVTLSLITFPFHFVGQSAVAEVLKGSSVVQSLENAGKNFLAQTAKGNRETIIAALALRATAAAASALIFSSEVKSGITDGIYSSIAPEEQNILSEKRKEKIDNSVHSLINNPEMRKFFNVLEQTLAKEISGESLEMAALSSTIRKVKPNSTITCNARTSEKLDGSSGKAH